MAEALTTSFKNLYMPEHYDPSLELLVRNMYLIDYQLQMANPNDLSTTEEGSDNLNVLCTTGRRLVKLGATGSPLPNSAGVVDTFRIGDYILQEWRNIDGNFPRSFRRYSKDAGGNWSGWVLGWNNANDGSLSGLDADYLDGKHANSFYNKDLNESDFNLATEEGKYRITSSTNAPHTNCTDWICLVYYLSGGTNELYQIAMEDTYYANTSISGGTTTQYSHDVPMIYVRKKYSGTWYSWQMLWNSGNDGAGSGLNADLLDGMHSNEISINTVVGGTEDNPLNVSYLASGIYVVKSGYVKYYTDGSTVDCSNPHIFIVNNNDYAEIDTLLTVISYDSIHKYWIDRNTHNLSYDGSYTIGSDLTFLQRICKVDGAGSGINADTIDDLDGKQLVRYGFKSTSLVTTDDLPAPQAGSASMYVFRDNSNLIGEGKAVHYGIMQIYLSDANFVRIAVSMSSGKVYRQTTGTPAWSEITPLIPVVSEDPSSPSEGQLWIRSDLQ